MTFFAKTIDKNCHGLRDYRDGDGRKTDESHQRNTLGQPRTPGDDNHGGINGGKGVAVFPRTGYLSEIGFGQSERRAHYNNRPAAHGNGWLGSSEFRERISFPCGEFVLIKDPSAFQFRKIITISGGHFFHDLFSSFLSVFLPLLIAKFSLSLALAGFFTVIFRIPCLLNPLLGVLSDRMNLYRLAVWAPAVTAAAMSLLGMAPSYGVVCILLFLAGISASIFHVAGPVMIARVAGTKQGRAMSFWMTGGEAARTFGPILGVWAVAQWGFQGIFPVMIPGIVASLFLHFQKQETGSVAVKTTRGSYFEIIGSMGHVLIPLTGIMVACSFMVSTMSAFLPTYMVTSGKSLWLGGAALAVLEGFGTFGTLTGGTISDRLGRRRTLGCLIPLSALLMVAFVYAPDWLALPLLVLLGMTLFATAPIELAIVQDWSAAHRGTANGLYMGLSFVIMAAVTVFVGWLSDHIGMQGALAASGAVGLLGTTFVFFLPVHGHGGHKQ